MLKLDEVRRKFVNMSYIKSLHLFRIKVETIMVVKGFFYKLFEIPKFVNIAQQTRNDAGPLQLQYTYCTEFAHMHAFIYFKVQCKFYQRIQTY